MVNEVQVERHGARLDVVLNRPERKNAITQELAVKLRQVFIDARSDSTIGCILLSGAGGAFCSGIDLKVAGDDLAREPITAWVDVHAALYQRNIPIVVALERFAINAGASLALAANMVIAGEDSFLQVSEIAMGVPAPMCQAWLHLRHSPAVADRITLMGDRISAQECLRLGVVSEVVAGDAVIARATEVADIIAGHPPRGRQSVMNVWRTLRYDIDDADTWFASIASSGAR